VLIQQMSCHVSLFYKRAPFLVGRGDPLRGKISLSRVYCDHKCGGWTVGAAAVSLAHLLAWTQAVTWLVSATPLNGTHAALRLLTFTQLKPA
jgi:hypothetical protein